MKKKNRSAAKLKRKKVTLVDKTRKADPQGPFVVQEVDLVIGAAGARRLESKMHRARVGLSDGGAYGPYGNCLGLIRDCELWRYLKDENGEAYTGFPDYYIRSEDITSTKASRLISAARKIVVLVDAGLVPMATLAQMEVIVPLTAPKAIALVRAAVEAAGKPQPSSTLLRAKAKELGFRKTRKTEAAVPNLVQKLLDELERAVKTPEHAELGGIVVRLKSAIELGKVAESATSVESHRPLETPPETPRMAAAPNVDETSATESPAIGKLISFLDEKRAEQAVRASHVQLEKQSGASPAFPQVSVSTYGEKLSVNFGGPELDRAYYALGLRLMKKGFRLHGFVHEFADDDPVVVERMAISIREEIESIRPRVPKILIAG